MAYYCSALDVQARLSSLGFSLRVDDDPTSSTQILQRATNKVNFYCQNLYNPADLLTNAQASGWVNDKATDLAVCYLCSRRGNPVPSSFMADCKTCEEELQLVHNDNYQIPGLNQYHTSMPWFSNINVDPKYTFHKARVEPSISEGTAVSGYGQFKDWTDIYNIEY